MFNFFKKFIKLEMASGIAVGDPDLHMLVYTQKKVPKEDGSGIKWVRDKVYTTPINDISNITDNPISKDDVKKLIKSINVGACQDNVSEDYIEKNAVNNPILMIMHTITIETVVFRGRSARTEERRKINPIGFICARPDADKERSGFYIDVICSKSNGGQLLDYFIQFAKSKGAVFVGLSSLPSVLSYYPRVGFEFRTTCDGEPLAKLPKEITDYIKLMKNTKGSLPKTSTNAYAIDPYANFMIELHEKGLSAKKKDVCASATITKDQLISGHCGEDGYSMKRCVLGGARKRTQRRRKSHRKTRRNHRR